MSGALLVLLVLPERARAGAADIVTAACAVRAGRLRRSGGGPGPSGVCPSTKPQRQLPSAWSPATSHPSPLRTPHPSSATCSPRDAYLGYLGPVIRAEVGDTIEVVFKNELRFPGG